MLMNRLSCLLLVVAALSACKRNRIPPPESPNTLLKSIEWKNGARENWHYDANGNLEWTKGVSPASTGIQRDFLYHDRTLGLVQKPSIKEDTFYFNSAGRITRIEEYDMGLRDAGGDRLDFVYDGHGKVIQMDYGKYAGDGYTQLSVSRYNWSDKGLLLQIATQPAGNAETYVFDLEPDDKGYIFSPWAFIHRYLLVTSQYEIWNLPVLQCMDRLPKRIVWTKKVNGQVTDQATWEYVHTADRFGRLERRIANNGEWMQFNY